MSEQSFQKNPPKLCRGDFCDIKVTPSIPGDPPTYEVVEVAEVLVSGQIIGINPHTNAPKYISDTQNVFPLRQHTRPVLTDRIHRLFCFQKPLVPKVTFSFIEWSPSPTQDFETIFSDDVSTPWLVSTIRGYLYFDILFGLQNTALQPHHTALFVKVLQNYLKKLSVECSSIIACSIPNVTEQSLNIGPIKTGNEKFIFEIEGCTSESLKAVWAEIMIITIKVVEIITQLPNRQVSQYFYNQIQSFLAPFSEKLPYMLELEQAVRKGLAPIETENKSVEANNRKQSFSSTKTIEHFIRVGRAELAVYKTISNQLKNEIFQEEVFETILAMPNQKSGFKYNLFEQLGQLMKEETLYYLYSNGNFDYIEELIITAKENELLFLMQLFEISDKKPPNSLLKRLEARLTSFGGKLDNLLTAKLRIYLRHGFKDTFQRQSFESILMSPASKKIVHNFVVEMGGIKITNPTNPCYQVLLACCLRQKGCSDQQFNQLCSCELIRQGDAVRAAEIRCCVVFEHFVKMKAGSSEDKILRTITYLGFYLRVTRKLTQTHFQVNPLFFQQFDLRLRIDSQSTHQLYDFIFNNLCPPQNESQLFLIAASFNLKNQRLGRMNEVREAVDVPAHMETLYRSILCFPENFRSDRNDPYFRDLFQKTTETVFRGMVHEYMNIVFRLNTNEELIDELFRIQQSWHVHSCHRSFEAFPSSLLPTGPKLFNKVRLQFRTQVKKPANPTEQAVDQILRDTLKSDHLYFEVTCIEPFKAVWEIKNEACNELELFDPNSFSLADKDGRLLTGAEHAMGINCLRSEQDELKGHVISLVLVLKSDYPSTFCSQLLQFKWKIFQHIGGSCRSLWKYYLLHEFQWQNHPGSVEFRRTLFESLARKAQFDAFQLDYILRYLIHYNNGEESNYSYLSRYLKPVENNLDFSNNVRILQLFGAVNLAKQFGGDLMNALIIDIEYMPSTDLHIQIDQPYFKKLAKIIKEAIIDAKIELLPMLIRLPSTELIYRCASTVLDDLWQRALLVSDENQFRLLLTEAPQTLRKYPKNWSFAMIKMKEIEVDENIIYQLATIARQELLKAEGTVVHKSELSIYFLIIFSMAEFDSKCLGEKPLSEGPLMACLLRNLYEVELVTKIITSIGTHEDEQLFISQLQNQIRDRPLFQGETLIKLTDYDQPLDGYLGMRNPHSVCYVNSFVQLLFHIEEFREQLLAAEWQCAPNPSEDLLLQIKKMFIRLKEDNVSVYNPNFFLAFRNSDGGPTSINQQMDIDEFKITLFDQLENLLKDKNFIKRLFTGKQSTKITSRSCTHESNCVEQFSSICLQVKGYSCLQESFKASLQPETLEGDNAYYCQGCKSKIKASRVMTIDEYPPYLIFVLKRFEFALDRKVKINSKFSFPLKYLDLGQANKYTLHGVAVHQGISQAGHYFSLIQTHLGWYEFNDTHVGQVHEIELPAKIFGRAETNKSAYVLVYKKSEKLPVQSLKPAKLDTYIEQIRLNAFHRRKERFYLNQNFLRYLVTAFQNSQDLQILVFIVQLLYNLYFRIRNYQNVTIVFLLEILAEHASSLKFLWQSEKHITSIIKMLLIRGAEAKFKAFTVQFLIDIYDSYSRQVQIKIDFLLQEIYNPENDSNFVFALLKGLCDKDPSLISILNVRRTVGRILDLVFAGELGHSIREDLKKSCTVLGFERTPQFGLSKIKQCNEGRHHKWELLRKFLQSECPLTDIEKNLLYQRIASAFRSILNECSNKAVTVTVAKYFSLLSDMRDYAISLIKYIFKMLTDEAEQNSFKYFVVLRQLLCRESSEMPERCGVVVGYYSQLFRNLYTYRSQAAFNQSWRWLIALAKECPEFLKQLRAKQATFYKLDASLYNFCYGSSFAKSTLKGGQKGDRERSRFFGIRPYSSYTDFRTYFQNLVAETKLMFGSSPFPQSPAPAFQESRRNDEESSKGSSQSTPTSEQGSHCQINLNNLICSGVAGLVGSKEYLFEQQQHNLFSLSLSHSYRLVKINWCYGEFLSTQRQGRLFCYEYAAQDTFIPAETQDPSWVHLLTGRRNITSNVTDLSDIEYFPAFQELSE